MSAAEARSLEIRAASNPGDIAEVRSLFRAYAASLSVDLCFQDFDAELAGLPGPYVPPAGRLFLAWVGGVAVGCVALRPLNARDGEMKRLFVRPEGRGHQVGRRLVQAVIAAAREAGYQRLLLDTLPEMQAAQRLYESLGFEETTAYVHNPVQGAKFLALTLT